MNENDSLHIAGMLEALGAERSSGPENADIILVNTCAVRRKSEEKLFSWLGRLKDIKESRPVLVGVLGCVAQVYGSRIIERSGIVDFVVGPGEYPDLPSIIRNAESGPCIRTGFHSRWRETGPSSGAKASGPSAFLTIMEGCNNFCTYCVVPFSRGREKSRPMTLVMEEAADLASSGVKEIQLLGQNVNSWHDPESGRGLPELLDSICALPGIEWTRFITSHPRNFDRELVLAMKRNPKVCRQVHLPMQSGSTAVLKAMNRGYTRDDYLGLVNMIREEVPGIQFGTDIIVGFPGESEADFQETCDMLTRVRFASIFSFRFSPRPHSAAAKIPDDVPLAEKKRRLIVLQELQKSIQLEINRTFIGKTVRVLCTGKSPKGAGRFAGRTSESMIVNFDSREDPTGKFAMVEITDCGPYSLHGLRS